MTRIERVGRGRLERRWYDLQGLRIHVRESTEPAAERAPTVVLVHGMVVASSYMVPIAERLSPFCRVYAPDLPGYGDSDRPRRMLSVGELAQALTAWMGAAGIGRAALMGNSLGCQVVARLAAQHPDRVESLILQGPTVDPEARTAWQQFIRLLADAPLEPPSHAWNVARDYVKLGVGDSLRALHLTLADRIEDSLPRVRAPALVVRGGRDPLVPQRWAEEVARLIPDGELRVVPGGSHALVYAAPLELMRITLPFIRKHHVEVCRAEAIA